MHPSLIGRCYIDILSANTARTKWNPDDVRKRKRKKHIENHKSTDAERQFSAHQKSLNPAFSGKIQAFKLFIFPIADHKHVLSLTKDTAFYAESYMSNIGQTCRT